MGLYSIIPGFCGAPWAVGAPKIVPTFHPTSNGPDCRYIFLLIKSLQSKIIKWLNSIIVERNISWCTKLWFETRPINAKSLDNS